MQSMHDIISVLAHCEEGTTGSVFLTAFMENNNAASSLALFSSSIYDMDIIIDISSPRFATPPVHQTVALPTGSSVNIPIHTNLRMTSAVIESKAISVTSSEDIMLFGINHVAGSCDAFTILPEESLGNEYIAFNHWPLNYRSEISVIAIEDDTTIHMAFPAGWPLNVNYDGILYTGGTTLSVTLQQYQTFQVQDPLEMTGTRLFSDKNFVAYSGNRYTAVEDSPSNLERSHLVEQLVPVKYWGREFYTVPFSDTTPDLVKIVTSEPNTIISFQDEIIPIDLQYSTRSREIPAGSYMKISADKPIMVAQYAQSVNDNNPAVTLLPSVTNYLSNYSFSVPDLSDVTAGTFVNYLLLVVEMSEMDGLVVEGLPLNSGDWVQIAGSSPTMVGQRVQLSQQRYRVYHPNGARFSAVVYGVESAYCAYAYPIGFCMAEDVSFSLLILLLLVCKFFL